MFPTELETVPWRDFNAIDAPIRSQWQSYQGYAGEAETTERKFEVLEKGIFGVVLG